jgi:hypothetical protein
MFMLKLSHETGGMARNSFVATPALLSARLGVVSIFRHKEKFAT